jgi:hypothetical protein
MTVAHQSQEVDLFPTNQLRLGGDLKTGSSGLGLLWRDMIVAAFGILLLFGFDNKIIFLGALRRRRGGLASIFRR